MRFRLPVLIALVLSLLSAARAARAATDAYTAWAVANWGSAIVSDPSKQATVWGETADPDQDGLKNLLEYLAGTDPTQRTPMSDCYTYDRPAGMSPSQPQRITAWHRTDDPDIRVICQTSTDLVNWWPLPPTSFDVPQPPNLLITTEDTGVSQRGVRQVRYSEFLPNPTRTSAFMRLLVVRRDAIATGPGIDPFTFTSQTGQPYTAGNPIVVRSNTVVLSGFTGTISIAIPPGVTLYVNGVAVTGTVALVKAGDRVWMEAYAHSTPGVPRHFDLSVGTYTARWTVTAGNIASVPDHPGTDSGYTPVEAGVSETGAAQISIPIVVSPGTGGMQPKLSINYSSQGGNGPLGLGFSLSGLSAISRVGRTVAQDGFKGGVAFDANDRFALDGQRLIAINGADGADGTEYRPEFDPSTRIRSYGVEGSGPQRWVVETKAGLKLEFGLNANSRIKPEGGDAALAWAVERITDTAGNMMAFSHDETARQRGEMLVIAIDYTINSSAGLGVNQEVAFEYEDRPDTRTSYVGGFVVKILRRMTAVESRAKEGGIMKRVRRYEFAFNQSLSSKRSRLQSVTEFPSSSAVGLVTTFNWGADVNPVALKPPVKTGINGSASSYEEEVADFDGDGRSDILVHNWPTANNRYSLYLAKDNLTPDASGIIFNTPIATGIEPSADTSRNSLLTGDFNGDGKIDLLIWDKPFGNQRYNLMLSNGNGFDAAVATDIQADADGYRPAIVADFNGDGRSDLLVFNKPFNNARYNLYLATDSGFAPAIATDVKCWNGSATDNIHVGDFNGDGLLDVLTWHEPFLNLRYNLYLGTGSGFQAATATPMQAWGNGLLRDLAVDVNGDGLTDFLVWHYPTQNNFYNLYLAKGDGTFAPPVATPLSPTDRKQYRSKLTFDFNSDGILDFLCWNTPFSTTNYFATSYLGNGVGFDPGNATQLPSWDNSQVVNQVGDFDGDGRSDVMIWHSPYTNFRLNAYFSEQATIDLLQGVVNGHGGTSSFT